MKRLFQTAATLAGCLVASCTLLVDTDGLAGDATPGDAASDVPSSPDGANEAAANDSGVDAVLDAEAGFCPVPGAVLCADFDDEKSLTDVFGDVSIDDGSSMLPVTTRSVSQPRSLLMKTGSGSHHALAGTSLVIGAGATIAFDIYIDTRGGNLTVASFILPNGAGQFYLQPQDDSVTSLTEQFSVNGAATFESTDGPSIPLGAWTHVSLDMSFGTRVVSLTTDGVTATRLLHPAWGTAKGVGVLIGTYSTGNASVFYDNVVITQR